MYQQYLNQAVSSLGNLSSDELKELLNDEDKLDERVNQAVSLIYTISINQFCLSHNVFILCVCKHLGVNIRIRERCKARQ